MNSKNISSSLIISTYNWPEALELCLISVSQQSVIPNEIIIADDGSKDETKLLIENFKKYSKLNIIHVWHEDTGFRLAEIRNKAIAKSNSDYIIQIDGDIVLSKNFVKDHLAKAKKGYFIGGSRVFLSEKLSSILLKKHSTNINIFTKGLKNKFNLIRLPFLSKFLEGNKRDYSRILKTTRGCNMSFWKEDLVNVNAYNNNLQGWGLEDSEISVRLLNSGIRRKRLKLSGIQFHLYHPENSRSNIEENNIILSKAINSKSIYCDNGLKQVSDKTVDEKIKITAIIPTFNEEAKLENALRSVDFADEIIVVDSFSTDRTVEIAKKYSANVIQHEYINSATQKNWIIPQAKHEWIILLDADEWLNPEAKNEIITKFKLGLDKEAYWFYRSNHFMGRKINYSGWQGDKVVRLFKRTCRYENKHVHAEIELKNVNFGYLDNKIEHNTYTTIDNYVRKLNRYAKWQAKDYDKKMGKIHPHHLIVKPLFRFIIHYIIRLGVLDGVPGLTISILQSYAVGMRYVMLWLYRRNID